MPMGAEQRDTNRLREICHDLRRPLNTILGWTYVLRNSNPSKESLAEGLEAIERNATRPSEKYRGVLALGFGVIGPILSIDHRQWRMKLEASVGLPTLPR